MVKRSKIFGLPVLLVLTAAASFAAERGTLIREESLYQSAGANSQKLAQVERGRDLTILERTNAENQPWLKVSLAADEAQISKEVIGWIPGKTVVTASTPDGDLILYGQAVSSERQAEERGGRKGAAQDAQRLYQRVADIFPNSALAAEAAWRSADIRWQLAKGDLSKPAETRMASVEKFIQQVIAKYPQSKQADLAAYNLLESQLCADWNGLTECPLKESALYEQYAREHPKSVKAPEALLNAAWRQAAVTDMYRINNDPTKSEAARKKAAALAQEVAGKYPDGDWKPRAQALLYKLEQKIPAFSTAVDAGETK